MTKLPDKARRQLLFMLNATNLRALFAELGVEMPPRDDPWLACLVGAVMPKRKAPQQ